MVNGISRTREYRLESGAVLYSLSVRKLFFNEFHWICVIRHLVTLELLLRVLWKELVCHLKLCCSTSKNFEQFYPDSGKLTYLPHNSQMLQNVSLICRVGHAQLFLIPQSQFRNLKEALPQSQFRNF